MRLTLMTLIDGLSLSLSLSLSLQITVTTNITELEEFLEHLLKSTNMNCLTPKQVFPYSHTSYCHTTHSVLFFHWSIFIFPCFHTSILSYPMFSCCHADFEKGINVGFYFHTHIRLCSHTPILLCMQALTGECGCMFPYFHTSVPILPYSHVACIHVSMPGCCRH